MRQMQATQKIAQMLKSVFFEELIYIHEYYKRIKSV